VFGDVKVEIVSGQRNDTLKILSKGQSFELNVDPLITKEYSLEENSTTVRAGTKKLGVENGDTREINYGIVVDIGTTTLVTSLIDLHNGVEADHTSALNPQAIHAQDVLSRIKFAADDDGLKIMYSELIKEINRMINQVTQRSHVAKEKIYEVIFSGNTCMLHLASYTNQASLGKYPYTPQVKGNVYLESLKHQLAISPFGLIYLPPIISAYVGADITSGVLASQLHERRGITLFVDIGTNGEMVIGFEGKLSSTSTAAGPAFEGMNITHGMRAGQGAVEAFQIEEDGSIRFKVIGDTEAEGICGSGLLDIVGELVAHGVINKNGKFVDAEKPVFRPA
jgi:uncharacterized 2Fe-2S/4Fe-4S cluster protein (DUF4445 family)